MIEEYNPHSSVRIHSDVLKKDRKDAGFTQSAFSAACRSVSLSTIRRAEQGYRVTEPVVKKMAQTLGQPSERYIVNPEEDGRADYVVWLAGDWVWVNVEIENGTSPRLTSSEMHIRQSGDKILGEINTTVINNRPVSSQFKAEVVNNIVNGAFIRAGEGALPGPGTICCLAKRHNGWLEGYISFVNQSGEAIENTRFIAVRYKIPDFERYVQEAKNIVEQEIAMFRIKKLLEAGYKLDDAIVMLASLSDEG